MDRDELDARIRSRRVDQPYRRGGYADEWGDGGAAGGYQPFEPEPEDTRARRGEAEPGQPRFVDNLSDEVDHEKTASPAVPSDLPTTPPEPQADAAGPWRRGREVPDEEPRAPGGLVPPIAASVAEPVPEDAVAVEPPPPVTSYAAAPSPRPDPWQSRSVEPPPTVEDPDYASNDDEGWPADEPYYVPADDDDDRRRGNSALPIIGFVALGVIALLLGVFFSNLFGDDPQVGQASPTPRSSATVAATPPPSETAAPSTSAGASGSGQPNASDGPPITFPDGFTAEAQPCVSQPNESGCNSDGATNQGSIWVYITFESGRREDVIGMTIVDADGTTVADASQELASLGGGGCPANAPCNGWLLFPGFGTPYSGLEAGDYRIRINRNGLPAAQADFTVT